MFDERLRLNPTEKPKEELQAQLGHSLEHCDSSMKTFMQICWLLTFFFCIICFNVVYLDASYLSVSCLADKVPVSCYLMPTDMSHVLAKEDIVS